MIKSLDGLRALAISFVVLSHAGLHLEGKIGVELFFVISGFLITKSLQKEFVLFGRVNFCNFYIRRVARLCPSLLLVVVITMFFLILMGDFEAQYFRYIIFMLTFTTDLWVWLGSQDVPQLFNYSWSLGVEEQFYLIWPLCFLLYSKSNSKKRNILFYLLLLFFLLSGFWSFTHSGVGHDQKALYFGPISHLGALASGSLIAFPFSSSFFERGNELFPKLMCTLGFVSLIGLVYVSHYSSPLPFNIDPSELVIATILSTFLVGYCANNEHVLLAKLLGFKISEFVGRLSYTIYLFNIIYFQIVQSISGKNLQEFNFLQLLFLLIFLVVVCQFIYKFYEFPLRRWINSKQFLQ